MRKQTRFIQCDPKEFDGGQMLIPYREYFSKNKGAQRKNVERALLHRVSSCCRRCAGRCLCVGRRGTGVLLSCRSREEPALDCSSNKLPGDLIQWPLRSFPSLRLWPLTNTCTFSPTQPPFLFTSRCGPVAANSKKRVLGNFPNEAKVQHK